MKSQRQQSDYLRFTQEVQAGKLRSIYVFYGVEDFLTEEAINELHKLAIAKDFEVSSVDGTTHTLDAVLDMVDTASLFASSRLVIVKNAPYFAKKASDPEMLKRLHAYFLRQDVDSCLIICANEFTKTTKVCKEMNANGVVFNFESLKPVAVVSWLRERLKEEGKTADSFVLETLVQRVGNDLRRLASETDKLIAYLGEQRVLDEHAVLMVSSRSLHGDIFALMEAVVYGRIPKAMVLLKDLLGAGEPHLRILAMLVRQFRLLGEAHEQLKRGCARNELASRLGIHPYAAQKLAAQVDVTSEEQLLRAVELLLQTDLDIKRGRIDQTLALETLVVALGQKTAS